MIVWGMGQIHFTAESLQPGNRRSAQKMTRTAGMGMNGRGMRTNAFAAEIGLKCRRIRPVSMPLLSHSFARSAAL